jgi:hypothetical protein
VWWNRQGVGGWRLDRFAAVENQKNARAAAEEDVSVVMAQNFLEAEETAIEALGRIEVVDIKRGFKNAVDHGVILRALVFVC